MSIFGSLICNLAFSDAYNEETCDLERYALTLNSLLEVRAIYIDSSTSIIAITINLLYKHTRENCGQHVSFMEARQNELNNLNCD